MALGIRDNYTDVIRRLLSYATMYVDLDRVPNFMKIWFHVFEKVNCGRKKTQNINDNEFRQSSKPVSNN